MLGRGLESLIPNKSRVEEKPMEQKPAPVKVLANEAIYQIEVDKITVNPFQPRRFFDQAALQELATSIREFGILQPLVVSKIEHETDRGTDIEYQLIAGERRLQAAKLLKLERVPAIIKSVPLDRQKLEMAIIENVQRENLNVIEAARAYAKLQDTFGLTQREIAVKIGKSRETVANALRLLNLPTHIQDAVAGNKISESQGRLLLAITEPVRQEQLFYEIVNNNVSVRDLKRKIRGAGTVRLAVASAATSSTINTGAIVDPEMAVIIDSLEEKFGIPVDLEKDQTTGLVKLVFKNVEDLQSLLEKLETKE